MREKLIKLMIILGIFAPLGVYFFIFILPLFWPNYNFINEYVSVLGSNASPFQAFINIFGFGLFGLVVIGFALVLTEHLQTNSFSTIATRLLLGSGVLIFILGFFPTGRGYNDITSSSKLHSLIATIIFVMLPMSIVWYGLAFHHDKRWGQLWVLISYILGFICSFAGIIIAIVSKFYFNGTIERIGIDAVLLWIFLVSCNCFFIDKFKHVKHQYFK